MDILEPPIATGRAGATATVKDLETIKSEPYGNSVVTEMENNNHINTIDPYATGGNSAKAADLQKASSPGVGSSGDVKYNPSKTTGGTDVNGSNTRPAFIGLGHELIHVLHCNQGKREHGTNPAFGVEREEEKTIVEGNKIRNEHKVPERNGY